MHWSVSAVDENKFPKKVFNQKDLKKYEQETILQFIPKYSLWYALDDETPSLTNKFVLANSKTM